jgi:branched-chain amino acid transport system substrate-binding protein
MASKTFTEDFNKKFGEIKQYAPYYYDSANVLIAAMQKADSTDPAKYMPEISKMSYDGATGKIEFDEKGDRKDAEITIFKMANGKVEPVAIIKGGKSTMIASAGGATATAAPGGASASATAAPGAAPAAAAAAAPAMAPAAKGEMAKEAPKK